MRLQLKSVAMKSKREAGQLKSKVFRHTVTGITVHHRVNDTVTGITVLHMVNDLNKFLKVKQDWIRQQV